MKQPTAIFTVSYPAVEPYIADFLHSLSRQTDKDFILFLINDGCHDIGRVLERIDFPVNVLEQEGHPAGLRKAGIEWVISEGAKSIIFADADDYFADNRIEISKKLLVEYDVICNELLLVGEKFPQPIPMLGEFFKYEIGITTEDIRNGNCLGLSNTSIRVDKISALMTEVPDDIIAFDWAFFALCLHAGAKAIFTNNTQTNYRQHGDNIASPCSFSEVQILRGVQVKREHYQNLSQFYKEYGLLAELFGELLVQLQSDEILIRKYCQAVRKHAPAMSPLWWEPIKSLKEFGL